MKVRYSVRDRVRQALSERMVTEAGWRVHQRIFEAVKLRMYTSSIQMEDRMLPLMEASASHVARSRLPIVRRAVPFMWRFMQSVARRWTTIGDRDG